MATDSETLVEHGKHTAPVKLTTLQRIRFLKGCVPRFVIRDFVSTNLDHAVRRECKRRHIELPASLAFDAVSKS